MTPKNLVECSKKDLLELARKKGISGYSHMNKAELIHALSKDKNMGEHAGTVSKAASAYSRAGGAVAGEQEIEASKFAMGVPTRELARTLPRDLPTGYGKDRIVLMVRDPYWLHCYWEITGATVQRAQAALGEDWHTAKPILRVLDVTSEESAHTSEAIVRDIEIHNGTNNWYIEVANPPRSFRVDIGYLTRQGRFYVVARSNVVTTPRAGVSDVLEENWAEMRYEYEKIYAMSGGLNPSASSIELRELFEERLRRPIGSPGISSFGSGAFYPGRARQFWFKLDAELIVYGATDPAAKVTVQRQPIKLREDGTFTLRFSLPDGRQIIPAVAVSPDGIEERTIVLAVEKNVKHLEPMIHDGTEGT
ncbi:MAG: DUF4912 domain-containing protein [Gemmataceae bacterium]